MKRLAGTAPVLLMMAPTARAALVPPPAPVANFEAVYFGFFAPFGWSTFDVTFDTPLADPVAGDPVQFQLWRSTTSIGSSLSTWLTAPGTLYSTNPDTIAPIPGAHQAWGQGFSGAVTVAYFALRVAYADGSLSDIVVANGAWQGPDPGPPNATILTAAGADHQSITITFPAPGEDPSPSAGVPAGGPVTSYDIRYSSLGPIDSEPAFALATPTAEAPAPAPPGTSETCTIHGLPPGTQFWVAMKAADEQPQNSLSALSNCVTLQTLSAAPLVAGSKSGGGCPASSTGRRASSRAFLLAIALGWAGRRRPAIS